MSNRKRERESTLLLGPVALAELLHLMAALSGGLGWAPQRIRAPVEDVAGDGFPVGGAEIPATERVPFVSVRGD